MIENIHERTISLPAAQELLHNAETTNEALDRITWSRASLWCAIRDLNPEPAD